MNNARKWAACTVVAALGATVFHYRSTQPAFAPVSPAVARSSGALPSGPSAEKAPTPKGGFDPSPYAHRTTSGAIATSNMNARIDALTEWTKKDPRNAGAQRALLEALLSRTQFFGTYSDFDRAAKLVQAPTPTSTPESLDAWAAFAGALHDFHGAEAALGAAERASGKPRDAARTTLHLATGTDLEGVLAVREAAAQKAPGFDSLVGLATARAAVGRFDEADATYRAALDAYRDVSPFPVAWTQFQRGMMWSEMAGRPERAIPLYRDAVARLPGYVVANVHLAELEAKTGDRVGAIERLRPLAGVVEDPEPAGLLAKLLADSDPAESRRLEHLAAKGYDELLKKHRNAFLDHAAEFFGEVGQAPAQGLSLALENLALRPTDRAYTLAIEAATRAGDPRRACALARQAGEGRPSVPLKEARGRAVSTCPPGTT